MQLDPHAWSLIGQRPGLDSGSHRKIVSAHRSHHSAATLDGEQHLLVAASLILMNLTMHLCRRGSI